RISAEVARRAPRDGASRVDAQVWNRHVGGADARVQRGSRVLLARLGDDLRCAPKNDLPLRRPLLGHPTVRPPPPPHPHPPPAPRDRTQAAFSLWVAPLKAAPPRRSDRPGPPQARLARKPSNRPSSGATSSGSS